MTIEGKMPWRQTGHRKASLRIAEIGREGALLPKIGRSTRSLMKNHDGVLAPAQGGLKGIEKAFTDPLPASLCPESETIHHGLDSVFLRLEQLDRFGPS